MVCLLVRSLGQRKVSHIVLLQLAGSQVREHGHSSYRCDKLLMHC